MIRRGTRAGEAPAVRRHRQEGSAAALSLVLLAAVALSVVATGVLTQAVQVRARADAAADLAALAGAEQLRWGASPADACAAAATAASANTAGVERCGVAGRSVEVAVAVEAVLLGRAFSARSTAVAGPPWPDPPGRSRPTAPGRRT